MAPRTRNSDKKHFRRSHRREVRYPRREVAARKSATVIRPPENYENLILYYLTKLKRLFSAPNHPHPRSNETSAEKMRREQLSEKHCSGTKSKIAIDPDKYTARRTTPKPREDLGAVEDDIKNKVYNVVNAAIEYGFANNVLEKKGDCFVFKNQRTSKIANRQPTPGPKRSYCSQCNCNKCKNVNRTNTPDPCHNARPLSEHDTHRHLYSDRRPNTSANPSRLHEAKAHSLSRAMNNIHLSGKGKPSRSKSCIVTRGNHNNRLRKVCSCRRCRHLRRRKSQKK